MRNRKFTNMLIVFLLVVFCGGVISSWAADELEYSTVGEEYEFSRTKGEMVAKNTFYEGSDAYFDSMRLGDHVAYCLDLGIPSVENGEKEKLLDRQVSNITTSVLYYGYPNKTPEELGVASEEEAELATQLAVWIVAQKKAGDDSKKGTQVAAIGDFAAVDGKEEEYKRITDAVKQIIDSAYAEPYIANNADYYISSEDAKLVVKKDYMIAGPYHIKASGFDVESVTVMLLDEPDSAVVCDENGEEKTNFNVEEDIYVKMDKREPGRTLHIVSFAAGKMQEAKIYGTGVSNDGRQDYVTMFKKAVCFSSQIKLKWQTLTDSIDQQH